VLACILIALKTELDQLNSPQAAASDPDDPPAGVADGIFKQHRQFITRHVPVRAVAKLL